MVLRLVRSVYEDDEVLILGLKKQEDDAFRFLYKTFYPVAERYVTNNNGNYDDAKDVFQECVIILTEKAYNNLELTSALSTFFYSLVKNNWSKKLRYKGRITDLKDEHEIEDEEDIFTESSNVLTTNLLEAFKNLGEKCQQILTLYYWQKQSMNEIAQKLNYSNADNVKNQKYKCLDHIRKSVKQTNSL